MRSSIPGIFGASELEKLLSNLNTDQEKLIRRFAEEVVEKLLKESVKLRKTNKSTRGY
jgi:hypothetical protein